MKGIVWILALGFVGFSAGSNGVSIRYSGTLDKTNATESVSVSVKMNDTCLLYTPGTLENRTEEVCQSLSQRFQGVLKDLVVHLSPVVKDSNQTKVNFQWVFICNDSMANMKLTADGNPITVVDDAKILKNECIHWEKQTKGENVCGQDCSRTGRKDDRSEQTVIITGVPFHNVTDFVVVIVVIAVIIGGGGGVIIVYKKCFG
ncbi:uncharacterized protein LOC124381004 [Silurus meridionalis]|uniref:uncharacterized protein LOC124381004 n=1 Tax=Silurus meridionalis TaxID=175797 RepID=UPI001EEC705A|nr:uncharacterized protein LOC124381004 [Silurus meridionalis]